ncbi:hypothetical protein PISMIDRAFT_467368 [Pisolithus microcarpus 441]|uniref:Uncharacterized protein n=1 Tax=Pisolithus microcarpus 441 TaxID=765257 RepID=A0A0C9XIA3_9AGAM|nr:hypothetical protein PISMIDRAFT_467368 [Pisolithus microcarpus 441]
MHTLSIGANMSDLEIGYMLYHVTLQLLHREVFQVHNVHRASCTYLARKCNTSYAHQTPTGNGLYRVSHVISLPHMYCCVTASRSRTVAFPHGRKHLLPPQPRITSSYITLATPCFNIATPPSRSGTACPLLLPVSLSKHVASTGK